MVVDANARAMRIQAGIFLPLLEETHLSNHFAQSGDTQQSAANACANLSQI